MNATRTNTAVNREAMKERREKLGYSLEKVAALSGIWLSSLWRIEAGHRSPKAETLRAIEKALRLRKGALLL